MMQDKELVQQIKEAINLVEIIGQAVKLRQQGNAWIGLCPFHSERTASFHVVPDKGFYHCFGCNKHGDVFAWFMEREGLGFTETKEQLAKIAGIELPKIKTERNFVQEELYKKIRLALEVAQSYYQHRLKEDEATKNYLRQRGIDDGFAHSAGFGFAPDGWDNIVTLMRKHGFSSELIEQTGLVVRNDRGSMRDFMRNRLTIPIHDARGQLAAFGGRSMGGEQPKYLNTRETQLFKKSENLFGLHTAKSHMREGALLVEGYFDVLRLHQEGILQAIAPLGTAVTETQLKAIAKYTKKIVLCFDGDSAGQRATERALKIALTAGFDIRLLMLPPNEDPDTWCARLGADGFLETVRHAPDWVGFVLDRARDGRDAKKLTDRMKIFHEFVSYYSYMPKTQENWILLQSVAADLNVPKGELNRALRNKTDQNSIQEVTTTILAENYEVDDLLRPLIVLCQSDSYRQEFLEHPVSWWDYLKGAPVLQAILDSSGNDSMLSDAVLGTIRKLESVRANKGVSGITLERALINLEKAFVLREINILTQHQKNNELPTDSESNDLLERHQVDLINRMSILRKKSMQ